MNNFTNWVPFNGTAVNNDGMMMNGFYPGGFPQQQIPVSLPANLRGGSWEPANAVSIANMMANASAINNKADSAAENESARTTLNSVNPYKWDDEVVSQSLWWTTGHISHLLNVIFRSVFEDVVSSLVTYNPATKKVVGTIYFEYNAQKKTEDGLLAFATLDPATKKTNTDIVGQYAMQMALQKNGSNIAITKEAKDIFSEFIILPTTIDKRDPNWPKKIRWDAYTSYTQSASKSGLSIVLTDIDINKVLSLALNPAPDPGNPGNKYDVSVFPGPLENASSFAEILYEVLITDNAKAIEIIGKSNLAGTKCAGPRNPYLSYT